MVAVVAGNGLGLFNTSLNILGGQGVLGQGVMGQSNGRAYVNAATGNLVLQATDETLSGRGDDLLDLRTYNSQGLLTGPTADGDGDGWRWDGERSITLTAGTLNQAGSQVTRVAGDGSVTVFTWDTGSQKYVSHDGGGAFDTVVWDSSAAQQWVFTDGSSQTVERYSGSTGALNSKGLLATQTDTSGNVVSFGYTNGLLTSVVDNSQLNGSGTGSGQKFVLTYGTVPGSNPSVTRLLSVQAYQLTTDSTGRATTTLGAPIQEVTYGYDSSGRLTTVTTDLTPTITTDNSDPTKLFTTTYTYVGTTSLVASVTQGDGTTVSFTYDASNRVATVTDANGTQIFTYGSTLTNGTYSTSIRYADGSKNPDGTPGGPVWTYTYDATTKQLMEIDAPAPTAGGTPLATRFAYDSSGNLASVTDAMQNTVTYQYDSQGNWILQRDAAGDTITRTYNAANQLLTQTQYTTPDPDGAGAAVPSGAQTTRYVYDSQSRLRFTVSAEGRVTENRYGTGVNNFGLLTQTIQYSGAVYNVSALAPAASLQLSDLTTWAAGLSDLSQVEQTAYEYDYRGNVSKVTDFATTDSTGAGVLDSAATVTSYIYDARGELLQTIALRGAARDQASVLTSYTYDGLGRELTQVTAGGSQTSVYNAAARTITVTTSANLQQTSTFDASGRLISISSTDITPGSTAPARTIQYTYDALGRLQIVQTAPGVRQFSFYDADGRLLYSVDPTGAVTGFEYNADGQLTAQTLYANRAATAAWDSTKTTLTVGTGGDIAANSSQDRRTTYGYDAAGRQTTATDAAGIVTTMTYDGESRVLQKHTAGRITQYFYDADGNQIGVLDPLGFLTENKYDAAGQLVQTIRYASRSPAAADTSGPIWNGVTNQTAVGTQPFVYNLPAAYDPDGDTITYSVVGTPPSWLSFNATTLTLSGTPPKGLTTYSITLQASDGRSAAPTQVTVQITVGNSPPSWATLPDITVADNATGVSFTLPAATDVESTAAQLTYSINPALLPPGLSFDPTTLKITGSPTVPGTYAATARVTDSGTPPLYTERTFVIQVTNRGPIWSASVATQTAVRAQAFNLTLPAATDPEGQSLTYRIVSGPAWLSINPTSHVLSGTPPVDPANLGMQPVVIEAQDPFGETVRLSFSINVVNLPPTWGLPTSSVLPAYSVPAGQPINYTPPAAADPEGEAITYSVVGGTLPPGVTFNSATGQITGSTQASNVNSYTVILRASDPEGGSIDRSVTIGLLNTPPTYNGSLPTNYNGWQANPITVLIPYSAFHDINNGVTLSLPGAIPGELPVATTNNPPWNPGTYFDPLFSNSAVPVYGSADVPTDPGTRPLGVLTIYNPSAAPGTVFPVTIYATDGNGASITYSFTVTVQALPPPPPPPAPKPSVPPSPPGSPPHSPEVVGAGGGLIPTTPITPAPAPVLAAAAANSAPAVAAAVPPAPAPLSLNAQPVTPLLDTLAPFRPADATALRSFKYYDGEGRVVGSVDEQGFLTSTVYNEQTNTEQVAKYLTPVSVSSGDSLAALEAEGGTAEITYIQYDSMGRMSSSTSADGTVTTYTYDTSGRLTREVQAAGTTDQSASDIRYDAFGDVTGTVGGVGDAWLSADSTRTLDQAIAQYGMRYQYDALGREISATDANDPVAGSPDANGHTTLYFYDNDGRLTHTVDAKGEVSETLFNAFGQVQSTRRYNTRLTAAQLSGLKGGSNSPLIPLLSLDASNDQSTSDTYDQRGLLISSTDAAGYTTSDTYDAFGDLATQVRTILQAAGAKQATTTTTQYGYDLDGDLLAMTRDVGGVNLNTQISYDAYGRVIRSVDGAGNVTTRTYTDSGRTVTVTDPLNRSVQSQYDAFGRVLEVTDALGQSTIYSYDDVARTISVTTPPPEAGMAGITTTTTMTRTGQILSVVTGNEATQYTYDADGHLLTVTDALQNVVVTNTYDNRGRLATTTDARGIVTQYTYDELNRVVTRQVDPTGLNLTTTFAFNALGQQVTVTEGAGTPAARVTSYSYDLDGRVLQVVVDPTGLKLATTYSYDGLGDTLQVSQGTVSSPNQQVTQYVFDGLGRRIKQIRAPSSIFGPGSAATRDLTTQYRYDAAGNVSRTIDADGQSTWYVHDADGELLDTINALGEVSQSVYDADGRVIQIRNYITRLAPAVVSAFGDVVTSITPTPKTTDQRTYFVYDNDGRQRFVVQASVGSDWAVSENRYDANGNVVETLRYDQMIDDTNADPTKAIDSTAAGLTISQVESVLTALGYSDTALGSASTVASTFARTQITRFAYDADNRLRFTVDAVGDVKENVYDNAGNVITTVRYAAVPTLTAYDTATINSAVDRTNAQNQVTHYAYDDAGRLRYTAQVLQSDGKGNATQQVVTQNTYDSLGELVQTTVFSNETISLSDDSASGLDTATLASPVATDIQNRTTAYAYDKAGDQVYSVSVLNTGNASQPVQWLVTRQVYDAMGHVVQTTAYAAPLSPLGDFLQGTLDTAVSASTMASNQHNRVTEYAYDAAGRLRFVVAPDGSLSETVYDALGQVMESRQFNLLVSSTTPLASITDAYLTGLRAGRMVGDGVTRGEKYTYDAAGRVLTTTDAQNYVETNVYDGLGNRTSFTDKNGNVWTYDYDRVGNVYDQFSPVVLAQLSNGTTQTARIQTRYYRDAFGNLTAVLEGANTTDARITGYTYDRLNRQVMVTLPGYYDTATGQILASAAAGGTSFQRTLETVYDAFGNVVRTKQRTGVSTYQYEYKTYDALGRQTYDVDALNDVTGYTYDAFGDQLTLTRYSVSLGAPAAGVSTGLWNTGTVAAVVGTDSLARTITTTYDNLGRKTLVTQPASTSYFFSSTSALVGTAATVTGVNAAASTHYEYDSFGDMVHESAALDSRTQDIWYYFDTMGRQVRSIDALGYNTTRTYDALGNLLQTYEYANAGVGGTSGNLTPPALPATSSKDRITAFTYDARGEQTSIERFGLSYFDPSTFTTVNNASTVGTVVQTTTYDGLGNVVQEADFLPQTDTLGNVTVTSYDALGRVISTVQPQRTAAANGAVDPFLGEVNATPTNKYVYNLYGQVVTETQDPGTGAAQRVIQQRYDLGGNLISVTDPNGGVKLMQYDYAGRLIQQSQAVSPYTIAGFNWPSGTDTTLTRRWVYDAVGNQTDVLDVFLNDSGVEEQSGQHTTFNAFGEITSQSAEAGAASAAVSTLSRFLTASYTYDNAGNQITKTDATGTTKYYYNLAGQITRQEQLGNGATAGTPARITETGYDLLGRAVVQRLPSFVTNQTVASSAAISITPVTEQSFDRWGNVLSSSQGDFFYNGGLWSSARRTTTYEYNADNQVIAEHLPTVTAYTATGTAYQAAVTDSFSYDLQGRQWLEIESVADDPATAANEANANLRQQVNHYDQVGNLTQTTDWAGISTYYAYDGFGNRVGTKNALGTVLVDKFDLNGNLISHSLLRQSNGVTAYYSGQGGTPTAVLLNAYTYDQANRLVVTQNAVGNGTSDWTVSQYDGRNYVRATFKVRAVMTSPGVFNSTGYLASTCDYDVFGNELSKKDAASNVQSWTYNTNPVQSPTPDYTFGRMLTATSGGLVTTYSYNDFGQVARETYSGTAGNRIYTYNTNGLLSNLTVNSTTGTPGPVGGVDYTQTTDSTDYGYTANGELSYEHSSTSGQAETGSARFSLSLDEMIYTINPTLETLPVVNRTTQTTYDAMGRIATVSMSAGSSDSSLNSLTYHYDEFGNRREIIATYNLINPSSTGVFSGVQTSDQWYTYNQDGQMLIVGGQLSGGQIVAADTGTVLTYDALGRRQTATAFQAGNGYDVSVVVGSNLSTENATDETDWAQYRTEQYSYNDLGQLVEVDQAVAQRDKSFAEILPPDPYSQSNDPPVFSPEPDEQGGFNPYSFNTYDLEGNLTSSQQYTEMYNFYGPDVWDAYAPVFSKSVTYTYDNRGFMTVQNSTDEQDATQSSIVTNTLDNDGNVTSYTYEQGRGTSQDFTNTYIYNYGIHGGVSKVDKITVTSTNSATPEIGVTTYGYDSVGNLVGQTISNPLRSEYRSFTYNNNGQITSSYDDIEDYSSNPNSPQSEPGTEEIIYVGTTEVGSIGAGILADATQFSNNYTPIAPADPSSNPRSYTVIAGDTLASIAQRIYGDSSLWYVIADANSLDFGPDSLPPSEVGRTYSLPSVVNSLNGSNTYKPYDPNSIIGDSTPSPSATPVDSPACTGVARTLGLIVVEATDILVSSITAAALSALYVPAPIAAGIGAGLGDIVKQELSEDTGLAPPGSGLDWKEVLGSALESTATSGLSELTSGLSQGYQALVDTVGDAGIKEVGQGVTGQGWNTNYGDILSSLGSQLAVQEAGASLGIATDPKTASWWTSPTETAIANSINPETGWLSPFNTAPFSWAQAAGQLAAPYLDAAAMSAGKLLGNPRSARQQQSQKPFGDNIVAQLGPEGLGISRNLNNPDLSARIPDTPAGTVAPTTQQDRQDMMDILDAIPSSNASSSQDPGQSSNAGGLGMTPASAGGPGAPDWSPADLNALQFAQFPIPPAGGNGNPPPSVFDSLHSQPLQPFTPYKTPGQLPVQPNHLVSHAPGDGNGQALFWSKHPDLAAHPGISPLLVNIPDGNKERVQGAVRDIWNYPLFPVSLPVRVVHFFAQNLVNLAVDTGLGPEKGDPAHEQLVAPVRTYGPMVLEAGAFGVGGTVASQMAAEAQAFADAAEAARVYLPGSIDTQPGIYYGNRLITTQDGLAHYWSTGQANLIPGALQKTPNTWYVIHGIQESAIDGADAGWIIKQTLGNPLPVRSVGLDSVNLDIQLITNDPAAVNAWIRAQGAKAVGSVLETPRTPPTP